MMKMNREIPGGSDLITIQARMETLLKRIASNADNYAQSLGQEASTNTARFVKTDRALREEVATLKAALQDLLCVEMNLMPHPQFSRHNLDKLMERRGTLFVRVQELQAEFLGKVVRSKSDEEIRASMEDLEAAKGELTLIENLCKVYVSRAKLRNWMTFEKAQTTINKPRVEGQSS